MYDYFTAKVFVVSVSTEYKSCSSEDLTLQEANKVVSDYIKDGFNIKDITVSLTRSLYLDDTGKLSLVPVGALYQVYPDFVGSRFAGYFIDFFIR